MLRNILLAALLAATSCAVLGEDDLAAAGAAVLRGDHAAASLAYERAARSLPALAPEYLLSAAESAVTAGDAARAEALLTRIPRSTLEPFQNARLQLLTSEILLARNQPALALKQLPAETAANARLAPRIAALRSRAQTALVGATVTAAAAAPSAPLLSPIAGDRRGYALLLPLSGPFAASAEAVRDGFVSALLSGNERLPLRVYDAGTSAETSLAAYRLAISEGASVIVGPLRKEGVAAVARLGAPPVPVLALNYLDVATATPNLLQLGLAPEDEARAVAERAVADGLRRAVTLTPASEWGERVLAAFNTRLTELGGSVVSAARYANGETDFSAQVQTLMNLDASENRHRALTAVLGSNTEFEPRRRDDIDFVFVAARPADARLILPQLRFHRGGALPVYAPSLVFEAGDSSEDLNGLRFCDMPWMLQTADTAKQRGEAQQGFPATMRDAPRLYALGQDAYRIAELIPRGTLQTGSEIQGATGTLVLGGNGALARRLGCAELAAGAPKALSRP